ncbi:Rps23 Pro-64 3,4-dihydroxylase Tpa1-like proline 4-hydroxylase [Pelomonas saccharophila]|uniref:Rps23 Pro-64 3,4-dihydroxylase Tpa1-like proline 4-hydroxylase n=1 Tax=Roseateles saccharophilus TaxID=304 RepID=A0ABU1YHA9_ROSSA|nr:2OG-Fe(II) oxygenase family protein [Roseateles saccharophilus]MDR7268108.1 Rps23 Pro-64 3,4-dihydroxylase Tpa1-like proline 4-hydroxylase [Roseateles saccharophilus]
MDYINPTLDLSEIRARFGRDRRVLIRDFFKPDVADALARAVEAIDWSLCYRDTQGDRRLTGEQLRGLEEDQRAHLINGITEVARRGFQFSFFTESLADAMYRGETGLLARFIRWMADEAFLSVMRDITGVPDVNRVYAQATMYAPGSFLLAHDDHVDVEDRRLAYVINLTRQWRPDWGGLLNFSDRDGSVRDSYFPHFNSLSLFAVPQTHFVSYVPPFAQGQRNAITGWLIAA